MACDGQNIDQELLDEGEEMRFARLAGLSLIVGVAVVLATAAAASANPLFHPVGGTFRINGAAGTLKEGSVAEIACPLFEGEGRIASALLAGPFLLTFTGCKAKEGSSSTECAVNTVGESSGVILTGTVHAVLVLILVTGNPRAPGIWLLPVGTSLFTTLAANSCTEETNVEGSTVGLISPIGVSQTTGKIVWDLNLEATLDLHNGESVHIKGLKAFGSTISENTDAEVTFGQNEEVT